MLRRSSTGAMGRRQERQVGLYPPNFLDNDATPERVRDEALAPQWIGWSEGFLQRNAKFSGRC